MACYARRTQSRWKSNWNWADHVVNGAKKLPENFPCRHCIGCLLDRAQEFGIRTYHEALYQEHVAKRPSIFVTLTYSDEHLPSDLSVSKRHVQLFLKRCRKKYSEISYLACGEYGEKNLRPHYHIALLGLNFPDRYLFRENRGYDIWRSPTLERLWPFGHSEFGSVSLNSARYVARYILKKQKHRDDPREPEFQLSSRRPALGRRWLELHWEDYYPADEVTINGKRYKPPTYYDRWMEEHHPEILEKVKEKRALAVTDGKEKLRDKLKQRVGHRLRRHPDDQKAYAVQKKTDSISRELS